jgi:hypothetical protein
MTGMDLDQHYGMAERTRQMLTSPFVLLAMAAVAAALVTGVMMRLMQ